MTMIATFRLMQDSGVQGPIHTTEVQDAHDAKEVAMAWANGELGHPWDVLTVEIPEIDYATEIRK